MFRDCGCSDSASGVHAGADAGVRTVLRRSGARLTSVAERVALLRYAGRDYRSRCSDGRSVRRSCCQVRAAAVWTAAAVSGVRGYWGAAAGCPNGGLSTADTAAVRGCPLL
jgi:hypothetical protein